MEIMNYDPYLTPYSKIHCGAIIGLNVEGKIIKLLDDNKGKHFMSLNRAKISLDDNKREM